MTWITESLTCLYLSDFLIQLASELLYQDEWWIVLKKHLLITCIDNEQDPVLQIMQSNNKYKILDKNDEKIINLSAMLWDQMNTSCICNILEHLARFWMIKNIINKMSRAAFRELLNI